MSDNTKILGSVALGLIAYILGAIYLPVVMGWLTIIVGGGIALYYAVVLIMVAYEASKEL